MTLNKGLIQKILALVTILAFLLPFVSVGVSANGFQIAFDFEEETIFCSILLIAALALALGGLLVSFANEKAAGFMLLIAGVAVLVFRFVLTGMLSEQAGDWGGLVSAFVSYGIGWWLALLCPIAGFVLGLGAPKSAAKPPYSNPYGGAYTNAAGPAASGPAAAPNRFCDQCGAKLDPGAAFCSSCGKRMG